MKKILPVSKSTIMPVESTNDTILAENYLKQTDQYVTDAFNSLNDTTFTTLAAQRLINIDKNRYADILPYDHTRVTIKSDYFYDPDSNRYVNGEPNQLIQKHESTEQIWSTCWPKIAERDRTNYTLLCHIKGDLEYPSDISIFPVHQSSIRESDYINANHIMVERTAYCIAAQGPKTNTINDFWTMAWQHGTRCIAMVTNLSENNREKCAAYAPGLDPDCHKSTINYGDISVTLRSVKIKNQTIHRTYNIAFKSQSRLIDHYQFVGWGDHQAPQSISDYSDFINTLNNSRQADGSDIIHCSAGVGRTGTVITTLLYLDTYKSQAPSRTVPEPSMPNALMLQPNTVTKLVATINSLRQSRRYLVQSLAQFKFLYQFITQHRLSTQALTNKKTSQ